MRWTTSFLVLVFPINVFASVVVSEIMYDLPGTDAKREWVEFTNTGSGAIDLTSLVFFEANTAHKIKAFEGPTVLSPGAAAIVALDAAQFKADNPGFSGVLVDTSWSSLSNDGETLEIHSSEGDIVDAISYAKAQGASGNGASLHRNGGSFIEGAPTPGVVESFLPVATPETQLEPEPQPEPEPLPEEVANKEEPQPVASETTDAVQLEETPKTDESVTKRDSVPPAEALPHATINKVVESKVPEVKEVIHVNSKAEPGGSTRLTGDSEESEANLQAASALASAALPASVDGVETSSHAVWLYILALAALLGVAVVGVLLTMGSSREGGRETNEADSYTIVE